MSEKAFEDMTEEELREHIKKLRSQRVHASEKTRKKGKKKISATREKFDPYKVDDDAVEV